MVCIEKDLGLIFIKSGKQRARFGIFVCEKCSKESKPRKYSDVISRGFYKCNSCSQMKHGLSKDRGYLNDIAKASRLRNIDRARAQNRKASKKYREANASKIKDYHYLKNYNLTKDEAIKMKEKGCAICGSKHRPVIDHDHITGEVRGVLCDNHNKALGLIGDTYEGVMEMLHRYEEYFLPKQIIIEEI